MNQDAALADAQWYKSSWSAGASACVEVAFVANLIGVRDTKNSAAGHLAVQKPRWMQFTTALKAGRFDR